MAPFLTIGLGPNFVAGETTGWAIETGYRNRLGALATKRPTLPLHGEPWLGEAQVSGLGERPLRIAEGMLKALTDYGYAPNRSAA